MTIKHTTRFVIVSLVLAWGWDQLFWELTPGVSYLIFVALCLLAGSILSYFERVEPAAASIALALPVLLFAGVVFVRAEPFTRFIGVVFSLGGLALMTITWHGGRWMSYNLGDYFLGFLGLTGDTLMGAFHLKIGGPGKLLPAMNGTAEGSATTSGAATSGTAPNNAASTDAMPSGEPGTVPVGAGAVPSRQRALGWRQALALLRGLLLATPVVLVLASLLASADPVFSDTLEGVWRLLRFENLQEYIVRVTFICFGAYLLIGIYYHALFASSDERVAAKDGSGLKPFLGWIEAGTVLLLVDALFAVFTAIQFRYFFGGQANIHVQGFTYAEYARRGFGELLLTAILSLLLLLCLATITRREQTSQRRLFTAFTVVLVGLVSVMLVSAFQRLLLYESAYGFSRIRTYTHIFMIWLGVLLLATAVLECLGRMRSFALAFVLVSIGFATTLAIVDVDSLIVQRNIRRALQGETLDTGYLVSLSDDAVPGLVREYNDDINPAFIRDQLGGVLACRLAEMKKHRPVDWREYNLSEALAQATLSRLEPDLKKYPTHLENGVWHVKAGSGEKPCFERQYMD